MHSTHSNISNKFSASCTPM